VLTVIALVFEECIDVVAIGGILTTLMFVTRQFVAGTFRIWSLRTCAIVGFGGWMFLGMIRYSSGLDAYLGLVQASYVMSADLLHRLTLLTALGFTAMLSGLQIGGLMMPLTRRYVLRRSLSSQAIVTAAFVLLAIALPLQLRHNNFWGFVPQLPFYAGIIAPLPIPAVLLICYVVARDRHFTKQHPILIAFLLVVAWGVIALETSRRSPLVAIMGCVFLLAWFRPRMSAERQFWAVGGGIFLSLCLYLGGNAIRAVSFSDKTMEGFLEEYRLLNTQATSVQGFYMLAYVLDNYPEPYPYLAGSSIGAVVLNFIPRDYWPAKPIGFAKEVALRMSGIPATYEYTRELDTATGHQSYSGTLVGEAYANFGPLGVPMLLLAFGAIVSLFEEYLFAHRDNQFAVLACSCAVGAVLMQQRGDILSVNFFTIHATGIFLILVSLFGKPIAIHAHSH